MARSTASHSPIPRRPGIDSGIPFLKDGYRFISRTADSLSTDAFRTTILGRPVVCLRGGEAARFFYEGGRFDRSGALPPTVVHLLQDKGSVQTLEGESHSRRKSGFLQLLTGGPEIRLASIAREEFAERALVWRGEESVTFADELPELMTGVAMRWAGIPRDRWDLEARSAELWAMVQQAGSFGPANWAALAGRRRTERWASALIEDARAGRVRAIPQTAFAAIADWTGDDGRPLPVEVAAVELINLLRPIVAVAVFIEFAFLALSRMPKLRTAFRHEDHSELDGFVNEIRRRTPFFPAIAGRATSDLDWRGETIPQGRWVMFDIFGTNHDPRLWPDPLRIDPTRYREGRGDAHHIVAQGAGAYDVDHRCPGEPATQGLVAAAIRGLSGTRWSAVGGQDLRVRYSRLPATIRSGLVLNFR